MRVTFWRKRVPSAYDNPESLASKAKLLRSKGWQYSPELGKWYVYAPGPRGHVVTIPAEKAGKMTRKELVKEMKRLQELAR